VDRRLYDTDLSDAEWDRLQPLVPSPKSCGRPAKHARREILNGIFYVVRSGAAWKLLPHDLPPWRTVYHYFWSWRGQGIWQQIHDTLREGVRQAAKRKPEPSGAILDSQSVRTTEQGGARGYDAAKQVCGRKSHVVVDTLGLVLLVVITAANVQDREGARTLLATLATRFRRLRVIWADMLVAYRIGFEDCGSGVRCGWRSYASRKGSEDLQWCPGAASWSGPSPGWAAIVGSSLTTSVCRKPRKL